MCRERPWERPSHRGVYRFGFVYKPSLVDFSFYFVRVSPVGIGHFELVNRISEEKIINSNYEFFFQLFPENWFEILRQVKSGSVPASGRVTGMSVALPEDEEEGEMVNLNEATEKMAEMLQKIEKESENVDEVIKETGSRRVSGAGLEPLPEERRYRGRRRKTKTKEDIQAAAQQ